MQKLGFSEFLRTPWQTEIGDAGYFNRNKMPRIARRPLQYDRHPLTGEVIPNVVSLRNLKTTAFLGMSNRAAQVVLVQFEHVLGDPEGFVKMLKRRFHLEGPDHYDVGERRLGEKFAASVKRRPQTPETVPDSDYTFILNQLDLQQEAQLGYSYRSGGA